MPRHEPAKRHTAGEPPPERVKMRLGPDGNWVPVLPEPQEDSAEDQPPGDAEALGDASGRDGG